jgi:hypothetical protein
MEKDLQDRINDINKYESHMTSAKMQLANDVANKTKEYEQINA